MHAAIVSHDGTSSCAFTRATKELARAVCMVYCIAGCSNKDADIKRGVSESTVSRSQTLSRRPEGGGDESGYARLE